MIINNLLNSFEKSKHIHEVKANAVSHKTDDHSVYSLYFFELTQQPINAEVQKASCCKG